MICVLLPASITISILHCQAQEYTFDLDKIEKRSFHLGGYAEINPILFGLDRDAAFYKLRFYDRDEGSTIEKYDATLQLDGSYERGITRAFVRTNINLNHTYEGWSGETTLYEGFLSLKPSPSLTLEMGKKTLKWGKGYAWNYFLGIRYLTAGETTYIFEYYHNDTGFTESEIKDYFLFIDKGYDTYLSTGNDTLLRKASSLTKGRYGTINPMRNYLYLRVNQKEPFDILYFTPALTWIFNVDDQSFSLSPEFLYTGFTNLELRLKGAILTGRNFSDYGEKQNDYRLELRARYYF